MSSLFTNFYAAPTTTDTKSAPVQSKSFEDKVFDKAGNVINKGIEAAGKGISNHVMQGNIQKCTEITLATKSGEIDNIIKATLAKSKMNWLSAQSFMRLKLIFAKCMCEHVGKSNSIAVYGICLPSLLHGLMVEIGTFWQWVWYKKIIGAKN